MLVLPVALQSDPCSKQAAISAIERTSISVTPARVIPPSDVSRIEIGALPDGIAGTLGALLDGWMPGTKSSRSRTSSLCI